MMDMQDQEEEKHKVDVLLDSGAIDLLGANGCADALEVALFPVEAQSEAQRSAFANWFIQNKAEGIRFGLVNWKVFREELERRIVRKTQAKQ